MRIYKDEHFFDVIDTEYKAYWLGFIYADGSIIQTSKGCSTFNRLRIALSTKDKDHLQVFANHIKYEGAIKISKASNGYTRNEYCYINIDSIPLVKQLINLGCKHNKTYDVSLPDHNIIPEHLYHHFVRGFFDGDGCISIYIDKRINKLRGEFSITTNQDFVSDLQDVLVQHCSIKKTKLKTYKRTKHAASIHYGGRYQLQRIYDYLYKDATIYLSRKYDKFTLLFS